MLNYSITHDQIVIMNEATAKQDLTRAVDVTYHILKSGCAHLRNYTMRNRVW